MKHYILIVMALLLCASTYAQEEKKPVIISEVPQYMIAHGIRLDFDKKLNKKNQWFVGGIQIFLDENELQENGYYNTSQFYKTMIGYGIQGYHKYLFGNDPVTQGPYLAYGGTFQNYFFKYPTKGWNSYKENDLEYITQEQYLMRQTIYKFGAELLFGFQFHVFQNIITDVYLGCGLRYSLYQYPDRKRFNENMLHFGYTGIMPVTGVRIGLVL